MYLLRHKLYVLCETFIELLKAELASFAHISITVLSRLPPENKYMFPVLHLVSR